MFRFIAIRLAGAIPTLLCILVITFLLTRLTPGDKVLSGLEDQSTLDLGSRFTYDEIAAARGLDKPYFYFSLLPSSIPSASFELPYSERIFTRKLFEAGFRWNHAAEWVGKWSQLQGQLTDQYALDQEANRLSYLFISRLPIIEGVQTTLQSILRDSLPREIRSEIVLLMDDLKNQSTGDREIRDLIPKLVWHGSDNQLHRWLSAALRLDFGRSKIDGVPVVKKVFQALRWTLTINLPAILLAYLLSILFGMYSGWRQGSFEISVSYLAYVIYAMPIFWLATILVVFFTTREYGAWTNLFPAPGIWSALPGDTYMQVLKKNLGLFIIPVLVISSHLWAYLTRLLHNAVMEEKSRTYVWMAKSKGLPSHVILWRHIFRNASFPLITAFASVFPLTIAGALVVEVICNIPGMGRLMYNSILSEDWNVVLFVVLLSSLMTITGLLVSDVLYRIANPRLGSKA